MPSIFPRRPPGDHQPRRLGGAGGRRDDRDCRRARATKILVREVEDVLVVGVRVDRHHRGMAKAKRVADDFHHRHEAVRGARRVGEDIVLRGVVLVVVHAEDDREILAFRGRGDDDFLGAAGDVLARVVRVGEVARRLEYDVDAKALPRQCGGILLLEDTDLVAVDGDRVGGPRRRCRPNGPCTESMANRCASVLVSVRSLTATKSIADFAFFAARITWRPMRPNPLMPTLSAIEKPASRFCGGQRSPLARARPNVRKLMVDGP